MTDESQFAESLPIGVIQTTVDAGVAWPQSGRSPKMSDGQDAHVWGEICKAMRAFMDGNEQPKLVVLPELSLPRTRVHEFEDLVCALNVIAIAGVDYRLDSNAHQVRNEGVVFIPRGFWEEKPSRGCVQVVFGKTHVAPGEKAKLGSLDPSWSFIGDENVYVFDAEKYGRIGVSICYDFMDLERAVMYRGRIHHLLVLAYNRDLGMFKSLAESLSRTVFCNVIVCNTGYYGGSLAVSPFYEAYDRTLYSHNGNKLFTTQVIHLPVKGLEDALNGVTKKVFKDPPPGVHHTRLELQDLLHTISLSITDT